MQHRTLVVMLKEPRPGRVKTRLGRDIGMVPAAWWFRHQVASLIRRLDNPRWTLVMAVSPIREGMASRIWPAHLPRIPQGTGNLGDRMARILRHSAPGPVLIIGGDIPAITAVHISRAFRTLGDHDAVFGPAPDGGYWLIGAKRPSILPAGALQNVRWSGPHALADSRASLPGLRIAFTDTLQDVDTAADLVAINCR